MSEHLLEQNRIMTNLLLAKEAEIRQLKSELILLAESVRSQDICISHLLAIAALRKHGGYPG